MDIVTYYSTNTKNKDETWVGYILFPKNGRQLTIRFSGCDEQTVIDRAHMFWKKHIEKYTMSSAPDLTVDDDDDSPSELSSGRGKAHIGTVWMWNKTTGERARVPCSEVGNYLQRGFIKAGPRTR